MLNRNKEVKYLNIQIENLDRVSKDLKEWCVCEIDGTVNIKTKVSFTEAIGFAEKNYNGCRVYVPNTESTSNGTLVRHTADIDKTAEELGLTSGELINTTIVEKSGSVHDFKDGFKFCNVRLSTYFNNKETRSTPIQKRIIQYLLMKKGQLVTFDELVGFAWQGKEASVFTLRNQINKVRLLIGDETKTKIKNISGNGYMVD